MKHPFFYVQWAPANQAWIAVCGQSLCAILGENAWPHWWQVESVCRSAGLQLQRIRADLYELA